MRGAASGARGSWRIPAVAARGDLARAAADFRVAVSHAPTDPQALDDLGRTLQDAHDMAGAQELFRRSLAVRQTVVVENSLANTLFFGDRFAEAIEPLRREIASPGQRGYASLWLFIARVRADPGAEPAAREELARGLPAHEPHAWVDSLAGFLVGRIDAAALDREANASPADKQAGRRCEADYDVAEMLLARDDGAQARPRLEEARRICPGGFHELHGVWTELHLPHVTDIAS